MSPPADSPVLLFDLDGTLVDTEPMAIEVIRRYFERHHKRIAPKDLEFVIGRPWSTGVQYLLALYPIGKSVGSVESEVLAEYRTALSAGIPTVPGSVDAVVSLSKHFQLGVVSGSRRQDVETILSGVRLRQCFSQIFGFEDYREGKPSPVPYLEALRLFNVNPSEVLVFEDSVSGIQSAITAGLAVVVVGTGKETVERPATPWTIPDFIGIDAAWIRARLPSR